MEYKIPMIPYNEFWLDCDTETLYSIIFSMGQKYKVLFYENNYTYDLLRVPSPVGGFFGEIRLHQQFVELREKIVDIVEKRRFADVTDAIDTIKDWIRKGYLVQAGVDLYYWIEGNCCYNKHHVEHYTLIHGYCEEDNKFYVMETDNECYREFLVEEEQLAGAMAAVNTLAFHAFAMEIRSLQEMNRVYTVKKLILNAKKICRSIRPLLHDSFWVFTEDQYRMGFYRDMTVMYILQINCRMKANRLLFEFLKQHNNLSVLDELHELCTEIEKGWTAVRANVSKLYFKENARERMVEQNKMIRHLLETERDMWKRFIKMRKQIYLPEQI
ncbi:putative uncharacterized protein [Roseburia sp. CAG:309]|nr:putative uncharacterized protein [Roseburia sp. CAG:309]